MVCIAQALYRPNLADGETCGKQLPLWFMREAGYDPPRQWDSSQLATQIELGSMQSKFMVFCRAMVMLIALIGLPGLAIWGLDRPIPPIALDWLGRIRVALADRLQAEVPVVIAADAPPSIETPGTEMRANAGDLAGPSPIFPSPILSINTPPGISQPVGRSTVGPSTVGPSTHVRNPANAGKTDAEKPEPMLEIERRLRRLGAGHYLLERWGGEQDLYRFRCEMPFLGQAGFHHHFEATAASPLQAMTEVLEKVDAWRTSTARRTGETTR